MCAHYRLAATRFSTEHALAVTTGVEVLVTGAGLVSPLGASLDDLRESIRSGRVTAGTRATGFEARAQVPGRRARRLSRLALMLCAATRQALANAALDAAGGGDSVAVVVATGLGSLGATCAFVRGYLDGGTGGVEPALFPTTVLNEPAAQLAIELGLRGPNLTLTHHESSFLPALAVAADLVALGRADAVVCAGCDELGPELEHALQTLRLASGRNIARPLDRRRDGLVPGESACALVLETAARAKARGARGHTRLGGLGLAADAEAAVRAALSEAGLEPAAIDYLALASNGTRALDAAEAKLVGRVFGRRAVRAGSILGQSGEQGASAALRVLQALVAIESGLCAGTPGFAEPDPEAPLAGLLLSAEEHSTRAVLVSAPALLGAASAAVLAVA
jgi:3-oxoacyl-[acyl-carrier-protein] synthase II